MKRISLKLPTRLHERLERAASQRRQSKADIVRAALEAFLNGQRDGKQPVSALDMAGDLVGSCKGPADLSTNPVYLEGLGK